MPTPQKVGPMSLEQCSLVNEAEACQAAVRAVDLWFARKLFESLGLRSLRIVLWDGSVAQPGDDPSLALHFRTRSALYTLPFNPSVRFGDGYTFGRIQVEGNLVRLIEAIYRGLASAEKGRLARFMTSLTAAPKRNTLHGSKHNIHSHYDLGNDFYKLWLDERMLYTCAYYPTPDATLEQAQIAKMDHVCRKLQLKPGQSVVECGCGWGALAIHMAQHYGARVKAYNISHEQVLYARQRAEQMGLAGRVEFIEEDYRNASEEADAFVSVGMLEHVGVDNYTDLGAVVDRCLRPHGRGLIHTIGRNKARRMDPWIEKRIFPGAYPPTLRQMMDIFEPYRFSVLDVENIRLHYARTCQHWLDRFESQRDVIRDMFDEPFVRAWRLYLAGSTSAFTSGGLQLFQVVFARHADNTVPMTREHLYTPRRAAGAEAKEHANV